MDIVAQVDEAIELLQNRRQKNIKGGNEYSYGRVTAFNECIATLKDLKNQVEKAKKL